MIIHSGLITREHRSASRWLDLSFEVPPGCAGITVELTYADPAILDIGCAGPAGWRGWSGSARRRFAITAETATPGYLPGEPEPGEWRVVLGLHRIPPEGAHAQVEVTLGPAFVEVAPPAPLAPAPRPVGSYRPPRACAGSRPTCTRTPCTPTANSPCRNWPRWRCPTACPHSRSPTTTPSRTTPNWPRSATGTASR